MNTVVWVLVAGLYVSQGEDAGGFIIWRGPSHERCLRALTDWSVRSLTWSRRQIQERDLSSSSLALCRPQLKDDPKPDRLESL